MKDYFDRFRKLKYEKDSSLNVELSNNILWVDDDMVEGTSLRMSVDKVGSLLGVFPNNVDIIYCSQDKAMDNLRSDLYSLIILDNDDRTGVGIGLKTLREIRDFDLKIPIVYTLRNPGGLDDDYVKENVDEVIATNQIVLKLGEIIEKYVLGEKNG